MKFSLALHKEEGSCYGVSVPDVPGCFSAGDSIEEAIAQAREAIISHCQFVLEQGGDFPTIRPITEHLANPDYQGAIWALVEVEPSALDAAPERVNISMPRYLLQAIDNHVKAHGRTRSGFLAEAALAAMADTASS